MWVTIPRNVQEMSKKMSKKTSKKRPRNVQENVYENQENVQDNLKEGGQMGGQIEKQGGQIEKTGGQMEEQGGQMGGQIEKQGGQMLPNRIEILRQIVENPNITRKELVEKIGIASSAIQKHLEKLIRDRYIKREGKTKSSYWKILKSDRDLYEIIRDNSWQAKRQAETWTKKIKL